MLFATTTLLITFSLLASALGSSDCRLRHKRCQKIEECSLESCCDYLQMPGYPTSRQYRLKTGTYSTAAAFCDMETDGGGWTVVMRRSTLDFDRYYREYEDGFGDLDDEFWYGLRMLRDITSRTPYEMRLDMFANINDTESTSHALYGTFQVEGDSYTLVLGNFTGSDPNLRDNLMHFNNEPFVARQEKVEQGERDRCIDDFKGGWWYTGTSCLSGEGQTPGTILTARHSLVEWYDIDLQPIGRTFQKYEMKIRPLNCKSTT